MRENEERYDPMKEKSNGSMSRKWIIRTLAALVIVLALYASVTVYIDPLFHYHAPLPQYQYPIEDERYQNDGILRHFEYNGIIAGTSLCQKFKPSEADKLFDAKFVKVALSGARYKEINDEITRAFGYGKDIKYVIRGLDLDALVLDKDAIRDGYNPPEYLYNNNLFDDVNYVFNKTLFNRNLKVIEYTKQGKTTTSFDEYGYTDGDPTGGLEVVLSMYTINGRAKYQRSLTDDELRLLDENLRQNVTPLVEAHPETEFYYFFSPYSIAYWDELDSNGTLKCKLEAIEYTVKELLKYPNIKLFAFCGDFDTVSDLSNYKDQGHYRGHVCTTLLEYMSDGKYLITQDNYREYLSEIGEFYHNYDYAALHAGQED